MIDLTATYELHHRLEAIWLQEPDRFVSAAARAGEMLCQQQATFERRGAMTTALTALSLDAEMLEQLRTLGESLHTVVELALDWVLADRERLERHFAEHRRLFPFLRNRTLGLSSWQGYSRYDAVITPRGQLKIIELNTCCPAGFCHGQIFSDVTRVAFDSLGLQELAGNTHGSIPQGALIDALIDLECASGQAPGLVGLVNDENQLHNELQLFQKLFAERGRQAMVVNAADLELDGDEVVYQQQPISLTYNKIRVSTAESPNHNWASGFEQRYASFLAGLEAGAIVSVNNLTAATIAEDKSLLAVLADEEFQTELSERQQSLVAEHVLWTARLKTGPVMREGEQIDLMPFVRKNRERLVIKPANEGRGFGVVVGKYCSEAEWQAACEPSEALPCVVQDYAAAAQLPVISPTSDGNLARQDMHLTIALGIIRGKYQGLFSRVSPHPVTNVGRAGIVQAVLVSDP